MVKYDRYHHQWKKCEVCKDDEDEYQSHHPLGSLCYNKRTRPKFLYLLFLSLVSYCFLLALQLTSSSTFSLLYPFGGEDGLNGADADINASICSSVSNGTICCDRSSIRTDVCIMQGDVRTDSVSSSVFLYRDGFSGYVPGVSEEDGEEVIQLEKLRPYTRKWETSIMNKIDELKLILKRENVDNHRRCDVQHEVPAVFFSTGGYTGNVYHEFNDGIIPLYITSQHLKKKVVFVILEYHNWWVTKYADVLSHLTEYPAIDFSKDQRVHCFPQAIVGLRIHGELTIDPSLMEANKSIRDFRDILDRAYWPRIRGLVLDEEREAQWNMSRIAPSPSSRSSIQALQKGNQDMKKCRLAILSRSGSRVIINEESLVKLAEDIGFRVEVVRPSRTSELAKIYRVLNASDVMVGVHGAAMTHFLFMKPGCVFIQIVPLGTDWAAATYFGEPVAKLGLKYIGYKIIPKESSLYYEYDKKDPILMNPDSVNHRGWEYTKRIYLDSQNITLNLARFRKRLLRAYYYTVGQRGDSCRQSQ